MSVPYQNSKHEVTQHGFRSTATILWQRNWPNDNIFGLPFWWKFWAQDDGKYEISLFDLEKKAWEQVIIDEYIPCKIVKGEPKASYAQPVGEEPWVLLMEKAGTGHRELVHVEGFTKKPYWILCQITSDTKVFDNKYIQHTGSIYQLNSPKPCFSSTHKYDTCIWFTCFYVFKYMQDCSHHQKTDAPWSRLNQGYIQVPSI